VGEEESEAVRGNAIRREDQSLPWEEPDPPSSSAPSCSASTSPCRRLHPPRRRAAPPFFTDAYTTACCHRGENELPLPSVDTPTFEPGGTRRSNRATTPPPLVMPAIEPG
jgi:hypothetical protein